MWAYDLYFYYCAVFLRGILSQWCRDGTVPKFFFCHLLSRRRAHTVEIRGFSEFQIDFAFRIMLVNSQINFRNSGLTKAFEFH